MALSNDTKERLRIALTKDSAGDEVANAIDAAGSGGAESGWQKFTVTYLDLAVAATTATVPLANIAIGDVWSERYIFVTTPFAGPLTTNLVPKLGWTGAEGVLEFGGGNLVVPDIGFSASPAFQGLFAQATQVQFTVISDGAEEDLDQLTQGSVDIYLRIRPRTALVP